MHPYVEKARSRALFFLKRIAATAVVLWRRYRALSKNRQIALAVLLVLLLLSSHFLIGLFSNNDDEGSALPQVTLASVAELTGAGDGATVLGSVRSVSEANILAESGGKVTRVHTALGRTVGAGAILAEIDNASQRAAVLQAEGAYESALASRQGTSIGNIEVTARDTYSSAYTTLDATLRTYVDTLFGDDGPLGPEYLLAPVPFEQGYFERKRAALSARMLTWRSHLASAGTTDPQTLLAEAESITNEANTLVSDLALSATRSGTDASSAQITALNTARTTIASLKATLTSAKAANLSQGTSATLGANASVKSALGTLRAAQAALEKTLVRAPIGGTVNFFPLRVGDYVTALSHVATVAQNGALEIVAYVSETTSQSVAVGQKVTVEDSYQGVLTSIAPALDPVTKQIELRVGLTGESSLINGQSVRITLPGALARVATSTGPLLLPLTTVKLTPAARVVFSVGEEGRLVAHPVEIGEVHGDRLEILTGLSPELRIVTDARGLSEGQKVQIALPQ